MTPEQKAELRRLAEVATPGPWDASYEKPGELAYIWAEDSLGMSRCLADLETGPPDGVYGNAAYIVAACNAIPELLDELEADDKHMAYLREMHDRTEELRHKYKLERDNLAALVARLREAALETIRREKHRNDDKCQVCGEPYYSTRCTSSHHPTYPLAALMHDTEAAATTWLEADQ